MRKAVFSALAAMAAAAAAGADIALPAPKTEGGMPLSDALAARRTIRSFDPSPLSDQELSDLLWAANGFNRPEEKKRTAPSAVNRQEIDIYVLRADGAYLWDASANTLKEVSGSDLRGLTGMTAAGDANFTLKAPVTFVFVVDYVRQHMQNRGQDAFKYACVDSGFIGQNIYLHCAANGLGSVFLGSLDKAKLSEALKLPETSAPLFAQTVGKPAAKQ